MIGLVHKLNNIDVITEDCCNILGCFIYSKLCAVGSKEVACRNSATSACSLSQCGCPRGCCAEGQQYVHALSLYKGKLISESIQISFVVAICAITVIYGLVATPVHTLSYPGNTCEAHCSCIILKDGFSCCRYTLYRSAVHCKRRIGNRSVRQRGGYGIHVGDSAVNLDCKVSCGMIYKSRSQLNSLASCACEEFSVYYLAIIVYYGELYRFISCKLMYVVDSYGQIAIEHIEVCGRVQSVRKLIF